MLLSDGITCLLLPSMTREDVVDVNRMYSLKLCYKDVSVITLPKACYIHVSFSKRDTLIQITQTKCDHEPVGRQGINLILNFLNIHIAGDYADFSNNLFGLLEMEFCKSLFAALFIVTTMSLVAWTAPLSYRPSDAEIVIRLSLMPTRANATKEVGYQKLILI